MTNEKSDKFLLSELKSGNERAFEKIFKDHYPNLVRYTQTIIHDKDKSQSLAQNVFVKLWEKRKQLDEVRNLLPYLITMVKYEAINYLKHEKRQVRLPNVPEGLGYEYSTEIIIKQNDLQERIIIAFDKLPERCREAFGLSRFENLTNSEIATRMGISIKGVEALITRSMKILRTELSEFLPSAKDKILPGNILFLFFRRHTS